MPRSTGHPGLRGTRYDRPSVSASTSTLYLIYKGGTSHPRCIHTARTLAQDLSFDSSKSATTPSSPSQYAILQTCHLVAVQMSRALASFLRNFVHRGLPRTLWPWKVCPFGSARSVFRFRDTLAPLVLCDLKHIGSPSRTSYFSPGITDIETTLIWYVNTKMQFS